MNIAVKALCEVREAREFLALAAEQAKAKRPLPTHLSGLPGGVLELLLGEAAALLGHPGEPCLLLAPDAGTAASLAAVLQERGVAAALYPAREPILYNITASHDTERARLSVLSRLLSGELAAVVATADAALSHTIPPACLSRRTLSFRIGDTVNPDRLTETLAACGYYPVPGVEGAGQFARRGGIVDFWADGGAEPVRVEFFGDEVDRIGHFDPLSQRLTEPLEKTAVFPAREVIPDAEGRARVRAEILNLQRKLDNTETDIYTAELAAVDGGGELPFADKYISLIYPEGACLLSYLETGERQISVIAENTAEIFAHLATVLNLENERIAALTSDKKLPSGYTFYAPRARLDAFLDAHYTIYGNTFAGPPPEMKLSGLFGFSCRTAVFYGGREALLASDLSDYRDKKYRVVLLCRSASEIADRAASLQKAGFICRTAGKDPSLPAGGEILLCQGNGTGFEIPAVRIAVLSTAEEAAARRPGRTRRARFSGAKSGAGEKILSYAELKEGDYVVHAMHGIGRFLGMQTLTVDGTVHDYITLQYAGEEKLFLRADKLDMVSRYIGERGADGNLRLNRIGGGEWGRAKARAKKAAREMAKELVELYAARQRKPGFACAPDNDMERDFAAAFEYEETAPQTAAIEEIKEDMMRAVPMDRLLCGDVGFGKTEVALRAAFKEVVNGRQVAILVPTTILALQHYTTLIARMRGFPVNIEMLSRFRKPAERQKILRRLSRGEIDIIVGTHALLGQGVSFSALGLLIVDEEQRFGVGQKEKIKQMAENVDVLTLTATPIPRTLNMAMNGIRDMSVLDEAPLDRSPVQTYVMPHDDCMIAEAIRRELARGGQVLYLYNRVNTIWRIADKLQKQLPDARIAVAHGQMEREEIEQIWQELVNGEIDILVCTTIIETGVDLPNANTLIVEDADRLGLAQLHQLRGRVGRSVRQAYAYCTYRPGKELTEIAGKRLEAIREYAEFGAGFRIALRDLEIRGAGNLLGAEQHGHIDSVGYDMYVRLLSEAVLEEQGKTPDVPFDAHIDLGVNAYIPETYIPETGQRIDMYKKLSRIATPQDREDVLDEFCDRFGDPPEPVTELLAIALCHALAAAARIDRVERRGSELRFCFKQLSLADWSCAFSAVPGLRMCGSGASAFVGYRLRPGDDPAEAAARILGAYGKDEREEKKNEP